MYPDVPIARGGARELGRGEVERRGEKAAAAVTSSDPAPKWNPSPALRGHGRCAAEARPGPQRSALVRPGAGAPARPPRAARRRTYPRGPWSKPKRSVERMPVPAATGAGNCPASQRDGPALEKAAIAVASAAAPIANASGRLAGDGRKTLRGRRCRRRRPGGVHGPQGLEIGSTRGRRWPVVRPTRH